MSDENNGQLSSKRSVKDLLQELRRLDLVKDDLIDYAETASPDEVRAKLGKDFDTLAKVGRQALAKALSETDRSTHESNDLPQEDRSTPQQMDAIKSNDEEEADLRKVVPIRKENKVVIARYGAKMMCPMAMALAKPHGVGGGDDAFRWDIENDINTRRLGDQHPKGRRQSDGAWSMIVTLGPQALGENLRKAKSDSHWRAIFALPAQPTQVIIRRNSFERTPIARSKPDRLHTVTSDDFAAALVSKAIGVSSRRSVFALHVAALADRYGIPIRVLKFSKYTDCRVRGVLTLVEMFPERMGECINSDGPPIDGFAAGEPFRFAALLSHGTKSRTLETIEIDTQELDVSSPYCCVTVVDRRFIQQHPEVHGAVVGSLVDSMLRIARGGSDVLDEIMSMFRRWGLLDSGGEGLFDEEHAWNAVMSTVNHIAGHIKTEIRALERLDLGHNGRGDEEVLDDVVNSIWPRIPGASLESEQRFLWRLDANEQQWALRNPRKIRKFRENHKWEEMYSTMEACRRHLRNTIAAEGFEHFDKALMSTSVST